MPHRFSVSPAVPPPSPRLVPRTTPLAFPDPLPESLNNVPADSPCDSTPHSSTAGPHTPPLRLLASLPPAPQTTRVCTCLAHFPALFRSTHTKSVAAPIPASPPVCIPFAPAPSPALPPAIPAPCSCIHTPV